jgi:hypothetical protein
VTDDNQATDRVLSRAQQIFRDAPENHRDLIKRVLEEERELMHLKRRNDIHQRIYEHVKRVIR